MPSASWRRWSGSPTKFGSIIGPLPDGLALGAPAAAGGVLVGRAGHRPGLNPHLRAAAADSRHPRDADGVERRFHSRSVFPLELVAARNGELGDPQPGRLR